MQQEGASVISTSILFSTSPPPPPLINFSGLSGDGDALGLVSPPRRRRRRRWWIAIIIGAVLVLLLGGTVFGAIGRRRSGVTYQTGQATRGNLVIAENATGPLQSGTYNLVFSGTGGKIDEIDVSVGDRVTKGEVLAKLDKTLLQDALNQAQVGVGNAAASLNAALASSDSSVIQSNANVSSAQTGLNNAETNLTQTQNQGAASVAAAQTALDNAETNLTQVTNTANAQKQSALDTYSATNCNGSTPTPAPTPTPTPNPLSTPIPVPTPTSAVNCTEALDTYNTAVNQANANIATAQGQVDAARKALAQAQVTAAANNTTAQNQINTAEGQLTTALAGAGVSQTTEQSQVTTAQSQLNTAVMQEVQAQDNLNNATLTAPHDGVVTQINGNVGGTPGGSSVSLTSAGTFIQIVDPSTLQVVADVNEADIANVQVGETARFTVNAYGNQQFTGTVSAVPPLGQTIANVVTYPVTIDVDSSSLKGAHLLPGMTANVMINAVQHNNVLLLPVNAVNFARLASSGNSASGTPQLISPTVATTTLNQARRMLSRLEVSNPNLISEGPIPAFVIEQSGQQFVARPVVLGLTDGTSYEILQGLSLSDRFIVGTNK